MLKSYNIQNNKCIIIMTSATLKLLKNYFQLRSNMFCESLVVVQLLSSAVFININ